MEWEGEEELYGIELELEGISLQIFIKKRKKHFLALSIERVYKQ